MDLPLKFADSNNTLVVSSVTSESIPPITPAMPIGLSPSVITNWSY